MMCCMYHYSDVFFLFFFFFNDTATTEIYTLSLHDALPIWTRRRRAYRARGRHHHAAAAERGRLRDGRPRVQDRKSTRLNSSHLVNLVCRLLLEKKKKNKNKSIIHPITRPLKY